MGIFFRVLVMAVIMPLTGVALFLGILLYDRREMLKGRTQKLENCLFELSPYIEKEEPPVLDPAPTHPKRDISDCTAEIISEPETSDFWDRYKDNLETIGLETLNLKNKEKQLQQFYKIDPTDPKGKRREKDANGYYITTGPGTMQEVLDDLVKKTEAQLTRLNDTRAQLTYLRKELESTITELNERKDELRKAKNTIVKKEDEIRKLNGEIETLKATIETQKASIKELEDTISEKNSQIAILKEKISDKDLQIENFRKRIEDLMRMLDTKDRIGTGTEALALKDGDKGTIIGVDNKWKFVMIKLSDSFVEELTRHSRAEVDMSNLALQFDVYRNSPNGRKYVTRIRLRSVRLDGDEKVGIADILENWQQANIKKGDLVVK